MIESPTPNRYNINVRDIPQEVLDWFQKNGTPIEGNVQISFVPDHPSLDASNPVVDARTSVREAVETVTNDPIELLFMKNSAEVSADVTNKLGLPNGFQYEYTTPQPTVLNKYFPGFVIRFANYQGQECQPMDVYLDDQRTEEHPMSELDLFMQGKYQELCNSPDWVRVDLKQEREQHRHGSSLLQAFCNLGRCNLYESALEVYSRNGFYLIANPNLRKRVLISERNPLLKELYSGTFENDNVCKGALDADITGGSCFGLRSNPNWKKIHEFLGLEMGDDGVVRYKSESESS